MPKTHSDPEQFSQNRSSKHFLTQKTPLTSLSVLEMLAIKLTSKQQKYAVVFVNLEEGSSWPILG